MWELLKLGIGGYVAGRSVEKAVSAFSASRTTTPTQATAVQNIFYGGSYGGSVQQWQSSPDPIPPGGRHADAMHVVVLLRCVVVGQIVRSIL